MATAGAGALVRTDAHHAALEAVVLGAHTTARPCVRKANRPPGEPAQQAAAALLAGAVDGQDVVVDLGVWARAAEGTDERRDLPQSLPGASRPPRLQGPAVLIIDESATCPCKQPAQHVQKLRVGVFSHGRPAPGLGIRSAATGRIHALARKLRTRSRIVTDAAAS